MGRVKVSPGEAIVKIEVKDKDGRVVEEWRRS